MGSLGRDVPVWQSKGGSWWLMSVALVALVCQPTTAGAIEPSALYELFRSHQTSTRHLEIDALYDAVRLVIRDKNEAEFRYVCTVGGKGSATALGQLNIAWPLPRSLGRGGCALVFSGTANHLLRPLAEAPAETLARRLVEPAVQLSKAPLLGFQVSPMHVERDGLRSYHHLNFVEDACALVQMSIEALHLPQEVTSSPKLETVARQLRGAVGPLTRATIHAMTQRAGKRRTGRRTFNQLLRHYYARRIEGHFQP